APEAGPLPAASSSAASSGAPNRRAVTNPRQGLAITTTNATPPTLNGSRTKIVGSNSMPTETKNSTAKASRNGSDSSAATWLSSDSLSVMPAKNAPSANDTSNSSAATKATPNATDNTARRNSSREPVCAM